MKKQISLLAAALLLSGTAAMAGERTVYRGRLGAEDVVLELERNGDLYDGRYFYLQHGVSIPLRGTSDTLAEAVLLHGGPEELPQPAISDAPVFASPSTDRPYRVWSGRFEGDSYTGTWRDTTQNRSLPFELTHVATYTSYKPMNYTWEAASRDGQSPEIAMASDPYTYLMMHEMRLTEGPEVVSGTVAFRMVTDPRTHFAFPRLTRHSDAAILARSNAMLEQQHWRMNQDALMCMAYAYVQDSSAVGTLAGTLAGYDRENVQVAYLSPTLMSTTWSGDGIFCRGARPDNNFYTLTLDLRRGGEFDFNRLLNAYGAPGEYGTRPLTPAFLAFVTELGQRTEQKWRDTEFRLQRGAARQLECMMDRLSELLPKYLALFLQSGDQLAFALSGTGSDVNECQGIVASVPLRDLGALLSPEAADYFPGLGVRP